MVTQALIIFFASICIRKKIKNEIVTSPFLIQTQHGINGHGEESINTILSNLSHFTSALHIFQAS